MQTILQYLRTFILASLPPALPSALPGARPRSSSSPLRSSPGQADAHIYLHRVHGAPPPPSAHSVLCPIVDDHVDATSLCHLFASRR
ncbi:hypothetical protein JB92DRAFT_2896143 [Gautieria morchelliformis]|nr:hypothetical protein JB92DRAFT_2896143 [Gautieria morchelliformis]